MDNLPGKLITVYVLATLLAAGAGAWLVHRYRAALPRLMRAPLDSAALSVAASPQPQPQPQPLPLRPWPKPMPPPARRAALSGSSCRPARNTASPRAASSPHWPACRLRRSRRST